MALATMNGGAGRVDFLVDMTGVSHSAFSESTAVVVKAETGGNSG
jgi:hypothetical protein